MCHTVKINALKKRVGVAMFIWEKNILRNILILKCHLYLDNGSNIYLGELLVGYVALISSLPFSVICADVTFQHFEKCFKIDVFH